MNTAAAARTLALSVCLATLLLPGSGAPAQTAPPEESPSPSTTATPTPAASLPPWFSRVNANAPGTFPPIRSFQASYRLSWSGFEAGHAEVNCTSSVNSGQISTKISGGTVGLARSLYQVDGTHVTVADLRTLHPLRMDQTELEAKKKKTAHVDFTPYNAVRSLEVVDRTKKGASPGDGTRQRTIPYPAMYDMHSALLYMRSLPLTAGESRTLVAMTAGNPYLATIKVEGRAPVKTAAGTFPAIECSLTLSRINKQGEAESYKNFKSARVWMSDDKDRVVVKAEAQVFIGTVTLDLTKMSFTGGR